MGTVNYLNNFNSPYLPLPYTGGDLANIYPKVFDVEDAYTITNSLVNQLKYGYTRFYQNIHNTTQGSPTYAIGEIWRHEPPRGSGWRGVPGRHLQHHHEVRNRAAVLDRHDHRRRQAQLPPRSQRPTTTLSSTTCSGSRARTR